MIGTILLVIGTLIVGGVIGFLYCNKTSISKADLDSVTKERDTLAKSKEELTHEIQTKAGEIVKLNTSLGHVSQQNGEQKTKIDTLTTELNFTRTQLAASSERLRTLIEQNAEKVKEITEIKEAFKNQLTVMSNEILKSHTAQFKTDAEVHLTQILKPFKIDIDTFKNQVKESFEKHGTEQTTLKNEISHIMQAHQQISTQAENLTKALRGDVKAQGNWGEIMLEKILEESGLRKGDDYIAQGKELGMKNPETGGTSKPDIVVKLPEDKHIVVDSKVSLISYEQYCAAEDPEESDLHLRAFLQSIRNHITGLETKRYQDVDQINSADFVLMFIPIEGALSLALQKDRSLFSFAWDKRIIAVSPTTLLATLRTIASVRRLELQNKNALKIAKAGGDLYDKVFGLVSVMETMGKQLGTVQNTYGDVMKKLSSGSGNLVKRTQDLKDLGAKVTKNLKKAMPDAFIEEELNDNESDDRTSSPD